MQNIFLQGKRIYLRPLAKNDLRGNYISWLNDEKVCEFNSHHVYPYTLPQAKSYIDSIRVDKHNIVLAIVTLRGNNHIGNISLQNIDYINRSAEFAIILGEKKYWGKGYAKEAAETIISHGFNELCLNRIYCGTSFNNVSMQRLATSLGMVKEGLRREAIYKHGNYNNLIEFGLLKKDYENTKEK